MWDIKHDRTRAARQIFVAKAVVTEVESEKEIHGVLSNLSLFGCYVETPAPLSRGVRVELAVSHSGQKFMVLGKVAHAQPSGMGIVFMSMQPNDQVILEKWME